MRSLQLGGMVGRVRDPAVAEALTEIERASNEFNLLDIAQGFTITGTYTETREMEVGVSTLAETQAFIATFINDCKRGGAFRST